MGKATIKDVAREAGVSTATISRVLNASGFVSEDIKARVHVAIKKLNYQPNAVARSLKQHKTNTIGVVIPDISNPYFMTIAKALEDTVRDKGYNLIFCSSDEKPEKEKELLILLYEKRVDAIVLATSGENENTIGQVNESGIPVVLLDRRTNSNHHDFDFVVEDNVQGAYELTRYLIEQGHKRIGVVNGSMRVSTGYERFQGYKKALATFGIEENINLVYNGNFAQLDGCRAVGYFLNLRKRPTAILSFNNTMSFGVLLELTRRGYRISQDITVASYGEVEAAQLLETPSIVSITQTPHEMGVRVGQILLDRLINNVKGPIHETFKPRFAISE